MIIRLILFLAGAVAGAFAGELRLLLVDESGQPFAAARTTVVFTTPALGAEQVRSGVGDPAGVFVARGTAIGRVLVRGEAPGRYPADLELPPADEPRELRLILREVRRPVALHVRRFRVEWGEAEPQPPGTVEIQTYEPDPERG